jgi:hypothetical protein
MNNPFLNKSKCVKPEWMELKTLFETSTWSGKKKKHVKFCYFQSVYEKNRSSKGKKKL